MQFTEAPVSKSAANSRFLSVKVMDTMGSAKCSLRFIIQGAYLLIWYRVCVPNDDMRVTGRVLLRGVVTIETLLSLKSFLSAEIPLGMSNSFRSKDGYR